MLTTDRLSSYPHAMLSRDLELRCDYFGEPSAREALNVLVQEVFGLDYSPWNRLGVVGEYTPFTLFDGDRAVANVSASPMHLTVAGRGVEAVQLGTVATLPEHRRSGLIRTLMEVAHRHWDNRSEMSFLFANETVLEFYQQFGYRAVTEHRFSTPAPQYSEPEHPSRLLDLGTPEDFELLRTLAEHRAPVSTIVGIERHTWLLLFHAVVGHPHRLRYLEHLDVVVISEHDSNTCRLIDVIGQRVPTLAELHPYIGRKETKRIEFAFTPDLLQVSHAVAHPAPDSHCFVRGPLAIDEPFCFPATSQA